MDVRDSAALRAVLDEAVNSAYVALLRLSRMELRGEDALSALDRELLELLDDYPAVQRHVRGHP